MKQAQTEQRRPDARHSHYKPPADMCSKTIYTTFFVVTVVVAFVPIFAYTVGEDIYKAVRKRRMARRHRQRESAGYAQCGSLLIEQRERWGDDAATIVAE